MCWVSVHCESKIDKDTPRCGQRNLTRDSEMTVSFRDTGCKRTADGLSLLLARRPSLLDNLRDSYVSRESFRKLLKTHLFTLYWSIQRIRGFTRMRYINLLTYLFTYLLTTSIITSRACQGSIIVRKLWDTFAYQSGRICTLTPDCPL